MSSEPVHFRFNQNVQDLEGKGLLDAAQRVDKLSGEEQDVLLKDLRSRDPLDRDTLNDVYAFVRYFWEVPEKVKKSFSDLLMRYVRDLFHSPDRADPADREKVKYYVYFLVFLIRDREKRDAEAAAQTGTGSKKKKKETAGDDQGGLDMDDDPDDQQQEETSGSNSKKAATVWASERDKHLETLLEVLWFQDQATDLGGVFDSGVPEETFLSLFWQTGELMLERASGARAGSRTRELALNLLAIPTCLFHDSVGHSVASSLWNLIRQHSHAPQAIVDLLMLLSSKFSHDQLARDLIQQLGETDVLVVHKNVGMFVEELGQRMPGLLLSNLSLVLPYLNNKESYQMRCSIIRALPYLISHLHSTREDAKQGGTTTRMKILETLADWGHDVSPYVRASVSTAWNQLVETKTLPLSHLLICLDMALEASRDKKVVVRKHALGLLENLLASNPFGPDLRVELFVMEIEKRKSELEQALEKEEEEAAAAAVEQEEDDDEPSLLGITPAKKKNGGQTGDKLLGQTEEEDEDEAGEPEETEQEKRKKVLMEALNFLKTAVMFIDKFEQSVPYFCNMLTSKTDEDVLGTIRLFATAQQFRVSGSDRGVRSMLKLIWQNKDNGKVRKVLMETVERLYIAKTEGTKRFLFPAGMIASNLVDLALGASLDELTSLGEVVSEMRKGPETSCLKRTILPPAAIEELWTIVTERRDLVRTRVAMCVLGMAAGMTPEIVDDSRSSAKLIDAAFDTTSVDLELARWAFHALLVASKARGGRCELGDNERKQVEMAAIQLICGRQQQGNHENEWFGAAKAALDLIPDLSDSSEKTFLFILENLFEFAKEKTTSQDLSRLFFVTGHVALKLVIVGERLVGQVKKNGGQQQTKKKKEGAVEEEEMLGATAEDDTEDQLLRQFVELELLGEGTVFACVLEWAKRIVLDLKSPAELRQCAVLALCKFMSVSERVCEDNLPLLFTVLRDSKEEETRSIIVISEGDLAFRFPNALEPYTTLMYRSLRDEHVLVRKNALMVLTHLALNDMIKVRGEVAEIAMRLEDDDKGVRDLGRFFFTELSKRGTNPIYNLLPDILGTLSREKMGEKKFKSLSRFLLEFVDKDKQCETLADKLVHRMHTAVGNAGDFVVPSHMPDEFQMCRDLAYCLEQLKVSDVLLRRLNDDSDLFKCVRPVLGDASIYSSVCKLVSKAQPKSQEAKRTLEELEEKMSRMHLAQAQDIAAFDKATTKRGMKKQVNEKNVGQLLDAAHAEMQAQQDENDAANKAAKQQKKTTGASKKKKQEDDDQDDEVVTKKKTRGRKKTAVIIQDEEEEDDE